MNKRQYFDDLAPWWDSMPWPANAAESAADFCRRSCPPGARRILDVGCGTGLLAPHLLPGDDPLLVVELDFAPAMLVEVCRKVPDPRLAPVCADALLAPFGDSVFDAVLCFGILPHLGEPKHAVERLWRMVRPGGAIAVGHFLGSAALNERHRGIGGPVANDQLPPAPDLVRLFDGLGSAATVAQDDAGGYYVRAEKPRP